MITTTSASFSVPQPSSFFVEKEDVPVIQEPVRVVDEEFLLETEYELQSLRERLLNHCSETIRRKGFRYCLSKFNSNITLRKILKKDESISIEKIHETLKRIS